MKIIIVASIALLLSSAPAASFAQAVPAPISTPAQASGETAVVTVPAGWTPKPVTLAISGFTMTNMWAAPASLSPTANMGLGFVEGASGATIDAAVPAMTAAYQKLFGVKNPTASHAEKLCNGAADGWYFENAVTFGALNMISEQTVAMGKSRLFELAYTRMSSETEDPAARKALDSLCIKS